MIIDQRTRRFGAAALGVTILGGAAATLTANPAAAAGIISAVTTVSCSVTGANWCISGNNTSSGIGVIGTSKTGTGLRGTSTSQYGLKATSVSGTAILAQTTSGATAVNATAGGGGYALSGAGYVGAYGTGTGYGLYGTTKSGSGYGVTGSVFGSGVGVYGGTASGYGVEGVAGSGTAGNFSASSGYAVIARTGSHVAFYGTNSGGNGSDITGSYIGLLGRSPVSGYPLVLTDTASNDLFYVDGKGDVSYHGGLFHFAKTPGGLTVKSYSPNLTVPTVEDTGTAQLVGGVAVVRLDPTFAASMDTPSSYRVFVTPNGDTHGLFVATKTANGFLVRESQGGRSTVTFDYRIVGTAAGQAGQRMAVTSDAYGAAGAPAALAPAAPIAASAAPIHPAAAPPAGE